MVLPRFIEVYRRYGGLAFLLALLYNPIQTPTDTTHPQYRTRRRTFSNSLPYRHIQYNASQNFVTLFCSCFSAVTVKPAYIDRNQSQTHSADTHTRGHTHCELDIRINTSDISCVCLCPKCVPSGLEWRSLLSSAVVPCLTLLMAFLVFFQLEKYNLTFDTNCYSWQIRDVGDLARRFPRIPIIMNHFGGTWGVDSSSYGLLCTSRLKFELCQNRQQNSAMHYAAAVQ